MQEIWKSLKGVVECGDHYEVSNLGRVRSVDFIDKRGYKRKGKIMSQANHYKGYKIVSLTYMGKRKTYKIHRLVALAFIPNPENKPEVNHKDGVKHNNYVENLEWVTTSENAKHIHENELHGGDKLTEKDKNWIRSNYTPYKSKYTYKTLAEKFNVSITTIYYVIHGRKSRSEN